MTRDDIIRMAQEAGVTFVTDFGVASATPEWLERFAALVSAAERERRTFELAECYRCGWDSGANAERDACAKVAAIALLVADKSLSDRVMNAIRSRG